MNIYDRSKNMRFKLRTLIFKAKDLKTALNLAWLYGDYNRLNFDGFRNDEEIVAHLAKKFEKDYAGEIASHYPDIKSRSLVHIITEGYEYGGHSQMLLNLVNGLSHFNFSQEVIYTQNIKPGIKEKINENGVQSFGCSEDGVTSIAQIVSRCLPYSSVALHIHPNDIIAAISAKILTKMNKRVLFIDHADHSFSFGRGSCSVVLDVSAFGWQIGEESNALFPHSFLGIPVENKPNYYQNKKKPRSNIDNGRMRVVSVGRPSKFRPMEGVSFVDLINTLLNYDENMEISLVGPDGSEEWWNEIDSAVRSRVTFHGLVTSEQIASFYKSADIYVDSFPVPGATAAMEAFFYGCTVIGLRAYLGGYNPIEYLYEEDFEGILTKIKDFSTGKGIQPDGNTIKEILQKDFSNIATAGRLIDAINGVYHTVPQILHSGGNAYKVYELPWVQEDTLRWPTRTFINVSPFLKFQIIMKFFFLDWKGVSFYQILLCMRWVVRMR